MKKQKVDFFLLITSMFSFLLMSASFSVMPVGQTGNFDGLSIYALVSGIVFWAFLAIGIVTQIVLAIRRKKWFKENHVTGLRIQPKLGVISFFRNGFAVIADVATIVSLIGLVISMVVTGATGYVCYIFISVFIFSFIMHCILNGKIFFYIYNNKKMLNFIERKRTKKEN